MLTAMTHNKAVYSSSPYRSHCTALKLHHPRVPRINSQWRTPPTYATAYSSKLNRKKTSRPASTSSLRPHLTYLWSVQRLSQAHSIALG